MNFTVISPCFVLDSSPVWYSVNACCLKPGSMCRGYAASQARSDLNPTVRMFFWASNRSLENIYLFSTVSFINFIHKTEAFRSRYSVCYYVFLLPLLLVAQGSPHAVQLYLMPFHVSLSFQQGNLSLQSKIKPGKKWSGIWPPIPQCHW